MELLKQIISMNQQKSKSNLQITLDDDFNVPDVKPDIDKIIKEQGNITIQEIAPMNDKFMARGTLEFNVLYISQETQRPIHNITGNLPFEEMVNMDGLAGDENISFRWNLDDMSTSLINSRKISVRAIISFDFVAESLVEEEAAVGVGEDEKDVQLINETLNLTQIAVAKKDTYRIKDEVTLPLGKDNIQEILYSRIEFMEGETRLYDGKIGLKGLLKVFILYTAENENKGVQSYEAELPINGSLDCDRCRDNMVSDISISISNRDMQVKPDDDGEERILDLEVVLNLDIKLYEDEVLEILKDLYSTQDLLNITEKEARYRNLLMKNNSKLRVVDTLKVEEGQPAILQICNGDGEVKIDDQFPVENGIQVEGVAEVQVLYVTEDDGRPIGSVKGVVPFSQLIEVKDMKRNSTFDTRAYLDQLSMVLIDGTEIEVKVTIGIEAIVFDEMASRIITGVEVVSNLEGVRRRIPSIVGYVVKDGDTLWDVAKEFYTTMDTIKELNELEGDALEVGDNILICK